MGKFRNSILRWKNKLQERSSGSDRKVSRIKNSSLGGPNNTNSNKDQLNSQSIEIIRKRTGRLTFEFVQSYLKFRI